MPTRKRHPHIAKIGELNGRYDWYGGHLRPWRACEGSRRLRHFRERNGLAW